MSNSKESSTIKPGTYYLGTLVSFIGTYATGFGIFQEHQMLWILCGIAILAIGMWLINKGIVE
ncbi:MAG: hypothetical protein ACOX3R_11935 [Desulfitobacteriia bacterium]|jgi:hypothetical protein